jgi:hypothetical protein
MRPAARWWCVNLILLPGVCWLAPLSSLQAQRVPLNQAEQALVNRAIEDGAAFLRRTQRPDGSWSAPGTLHHIGYAALPGLTLLECGVPASDPTLQRIARGIRRAAPSLEQTYELSLAILFLDRLGESRDRQLIETFALRLVAGQTSTGGWGYKCPRVGARTQQEILVLLRKLERQPPPDFMVAGPGRDPLPGRPVARQPDSGLAGRPVDRRPPLEGGAVGKPTGVPGTAIGRQPSPGESPRGGTSTAAEKSPGERPTGPDTGSTIIDRERGDRPGSTIPIPGKPSEVGPGLLEDQTLPAGPDKAPPTGEQARPPSPQADHGSRRWRWCIKSGDPGRTEKDDPADDVKPIVIPPRLRHLPVFQDPRLLVLQDPQNRLLQPLQATTDNSNTQFAILALWAAQRHDVPLKRSLHLMVHRFQTSQNQNGSWDYRYTLGGGNREGPAMTAVGLLGLAVGHGLAAPGQGAERKPVLDPAILNGFVALNRHLGKPLGRWQNVPQVNLYLLWSIERVAVLYNLPDIAGKDWYRWGAEMLVANQDPLGHWRNGGYPGANPVVDTCLALLFLKRANLSRDLTDRLPIDGNELAASIAKKTSQPNPKPGDNSPPPEEERPPAEADQRPGGPSPSAPDPTLPATSPVRAGGSLEDSLDSSTSTPVRGPIRLLSILLLLGLAALVLLGAILYVVKHLDTDKEERPEKPERRRKKEARKGAALGG